MENTKISGMPPKTPGTLNDVIATGRYWIPAYLAQDTQDKNGQLDLGQMFLCLYNAISSTVTAEINRKIENGEIGIGGGSGSTPSGESSTDLTTLTNQVAGLRTRIESLENPNTWPTHHIKLVAPGKSPVMYYLGTGRTNSTYTASNPIVINTTDVDLPNFFVSLSIGAPSVTVDNYVQITANITVSSKQDTIQLLGGYIGNVVVTGELSIGSTYEFTPVTVDKSSVKLDSTNLLEQFSVTLTSSAQVPEGTSTSSINLVQVTCSVSGVALGKRATYVTQGSDGTVTMVSGQIKLPVNAS